MPVENRDYYRILEIDPTADSRTVGAAYKWMLQKLRPDAALEAVHQLKEVNEAFEVLSDPAKRALYDYLRATRNSAQTRMQATMRREEQERARQRAERLEQRLRAWRQRVNSDQPLGEQA